MTYRLPKHIIPKKYHIILKFHETTFNGICMINFTSSIENSHEIILHGKNLSITSATMDNVPATTITYQDELITFTFDTIPSSGTLIIKYMGQISDDMNGVYKSTRDNETIISTQFEPLYARHCIPCFDEPDFKAIFQLHIMAAKGKTVLSNTHVIETYPIDDSILWTFAQTPVMSSYLLAFYIGPDTYLEKYWHGICIRVYSYKDSQYSEYALDIAIRCMEFMTDYFGIPYPLKKMDLISVPRFSAGAMENWGLITFRENFLLCDETSDINDKFEIARIICHEIAHQWFGNLVTMTWWSDLWLNESFATWMSWETVDHLFPEWRVWEHYYKHETLTAMQLDQLENSHPVSVHITNPHHINEIFDGISYAKGSTVIRVLIKLLGADTFKYGIQYYLHTYSYKNATTDNLWECLEEISHKPVKEMIHAWIYQQNYPILFIKEHDADHLSISQNSCNASSTCKYIWSIPLTNTVILNEKQMIIKKSKFPCKINKDIWCMCRIHYDTPILNNILQKKIHLLSMIDITGIVSDAFILLRTNKNTLDEYTKYLILITNYLSSHHIQYAHLVLQIILYQYKYCQAINHTHMKYVYHTILYPLISKLEIQFTTDKIDDVNIHTGNVVIFKLMCELKTPRAMDYCYRLLSKIDLFIDTMTLYDEIAMMHIIQYNNTIFDRLIETENPDMHILGMTRDYDRYHRFLNLIYDSNTSEQDKAKICWVAGNNPVMNKYLWPYIKTHWDHIWDIFQHDHFILVDLIESLDNLVDNGTLVDDITVFFEDKSIFHNMIKKTIERIKDNTAFIKSNY